ncbi:MAG: sugar phosphate isomerase/epimerase [Phycisphaerae bacterium]|nr:sugar phosphate isomerase/epimerase [Phycisphaerae bacterium]
MNRHFSISMIVLLMAGSTAFSQKTPTGNPSDFRVKTCLHSVSYAGFWRGQARLSVDAFLLKAKQLGFDGIMLMAKRPHVSILDYDADARKALKQRIQSLDLALVCLAGYTDFTAGIDKAGIPNMEIQVAYVGELAKLAKDLGTPMVRIFTGYERPDVPFDKQYALVVEGLKLAGKKAAEYGITLAVQNHHDIASHHETMLWLLNEVNLPNVKAAFDAWTPTLEGLDSVQMKAAIERMKPYIVHTTAAQYVRLPRYHYDHTLTNFMQDETVIRAVPMGEGFIDYDTFLRSLQAIGYQGYIAYEMCEVLDGGGDIDNLDRTARAFLEYVARFRKNSER